MSDDFKALAAKLLQDAPHLLAQWFPAGKQHGHEFRLGDLNGAAGQSLAVNLDTGIWKDFAGGKGGADLISLYAAANSIKQGEAFTALGGTYSKKTNKKSDATYMPGHPCEKIPPHRRLGVPPVAVYDYFDTAGKRIGHICRFEPPGARKEFCPLTHWRNPDGTAYWSYKKWPMTSPLYRLPELQVTTGNTVLIVEGEGKCDRAQRLAPNMSVVAWPGGAKGIAHVDWSPLAGRNVWIWPDNDKDGISAAQNIKAILPHAKIVKIPEGAPEKWDLGDAPDGFDIAAHLVEDAQLPAQAAALPDIKKSGDLAARLDALNYEYAVIIHGSKVFVMRHWWGQDGQSKLIFLSQRDFLFLQDNNLVYIEDDEGKTKEVNVGKAWLKWKDRQEYEEAYFEPCGPEYSRRYNLWQGFNKLTPAPGDCSLFIAHIHDNICSGNKEYFDWVMAWLADMFQRPARKIGTALVLRGEMGIGKGVFAHIIGHLLGKHYMPISQRSQLIGKFNSHMADKLLMFVDEGWWSDDSEYGVGVLRALITEPVVTIEMKGKDAITMANYTRFIIAANADWVVPVSGKDERRFSILTVNPEKQGNKAYFSAIQQQMKAGGYEALLHTLLTHKYDESLAGKIINSDALADNKLYSMSDELKWWHECLMEERIEDFRLHNNGQNDIECRKFYDNYLKWCDRTQIRPVTARVLPKKLKDAIVNFNRTRKFVGTAGERDYFYLLQDISVMREYFERHIGAKIDWEDSF